MAASRPGCGQSCRYWAEEYITLFACLERTRRRYELSAERIAACPLASRNSSRAAVQAISLKKHLQRSLPGARAARIGGNPARQDRARGEGIRAIRAVALGQLQHSGRSHLPLAAGLRAPPAVLDYLIAHEVAHPEGNEPQRSVSGRSSRRHSASRTHTERRAAGSSAKAIRCTAITDRSFMTQYSKAARPRTRLEIPPGTRCRKKPMHEGVS